MDFENEIATDRAAEVSDATVEIPPGDTRVDAIFYCVPHDSPTKDHQFEDLVRIAERDASERDWRLIRDGLARVVIAEERAAPNGPVTLYRVVPQVARDLARQFVYVEQDRSGKTDPKGRPLFEQMKRDAAAGKFDRLLVSRISMLSGDVRDVITVVHELANNGVSILPVASQTGPIDTTTGKLFGSVQAWLTEIDNDHRSEAIRAGQARARAGGALVGRPKVIFDQGAVVSLRDFEHKSWSETAKMVGTSVGSARRAYNAIKNSPAPCQNSATKGL